MASNPDRSLCIIGTAKRTWHPGQAAPEPLEMWEEVARSAAADTESRSDVLAAVDDLGVVHCQSWAYDDPPGRLASRLGIQRARMSQSILAGTSPQRLLNAAAERMTAGDCQLALVVGGEALASRRAIQRAGETVRWSSPHPNPPTLPVDLDEWYLQTEIDHGILPAWLTFALLGQARWAERGATDEDRCAIGRLMERFNEVAVGNPAAWFRKPRVAAELDVPSPDNRMVAVPFTKRMTAFLDVDMAAANLLATRAEADRLGVPEDRRVYLRGWGFARDEVHIGARAELGSSPAMRTATGRALRMAGVTVDDVQIFDLYSCFPSAVQFAIDALGLDPTDPRPLTVTGGLPYHGGPSSNYMGHSISHMVDELRARPGLGLVTGIGMHMTKHVAAVWSSSAGDPLPPEPDAWPAHRAAEDVHREGRGSARIAAATVVHHPDGTPSHAVAICDLPGGGRCYARSDEEDIIATVADDGWVDATAALAAGPGDTNTFRC